MNFPDSKNCDLHVRGIGGKAAYDYGKSVANWCMIKMRTKEKVSV